MRRPLGSKTSDSFNEAHSGGAGIRAACHGKRKHPPPYSIRFNEQERVSLTRDAGGKSWAAYIRSKLFPDTDQPKQRQTRKKRRPEADEIKIAQVLGALGQSRLSQNLNQIAKAANLGVLPVSSELEKELFDACADIQAMRHTLIQALGLANDGDQP